MVYGSGGGDRERERERETGPVLIFLRPGAK